MNKFDAAAIGIYIDDILDEVDAKRVRSKNVQGPVSKQMKNGIFLVRGLVNNLIARFDDTGDPTFLRKSKLELEDQVTDLKRKDKEKSAELDFIKSKMYLLKKELDIVKRSLEKSKDTYPIGDSDSSIADPSSGPSMKLTTVFPAPLPQRVPRASTRGVPANPSVVHPVESERRRNVSYKGNEICDESQNETEDLYRRIELWNKVRPMEERILNPFLENLAPRPPPPPPKIERRGRKPKVQKKN